MDYKVNIFAHNEEKVIAACINSVLMQSLCSEDKLFVTIISNGCSDETENIVKKLSHDDQRISLFSIKESGKVNALRTFIESYFSNYCIDGDSDFIFFMDADVQLSDSTTLSRLMNNLLIDNSLSAVSARCIPESVYTRKKDFVSCLFRIQARMHEVFRPNIFRGMLYCVRASVMKRLSFPDNILSDDICMEICLDGHFKTDYEVSIVYALHHGIRREIRRNFMHCLGVLQAYRFLKEKKIQKLDTINSNKTYKIKTLDQFEIIKYLFKKADIYSIFMLSIHGIIYRYNVYKARKILNKYGIDGVDYRSFWKTRK